MKTVKFCCKIAIVIATCLFTSCIDEKYNLDDVDMTIGTTGDLTLPTSSTGEILLKNILDLEEDGIVQVVNDQYFLIEDGKANIPEINIDPITIATPELAPIDASISIDDIFSETRPAHKGRSAASNNMNITLPEIPNKTYTYTIQERDKAYYSFNNFASGNLPVEVVDLKSVSFGDGSVLDAKIQISFDAGHDFINKVHLDNLKITVPAGLHVSQAHFIHFTSKNGEEVLEDIEAIEIDNEKGIIYLTDTDQNTIIDYDHEIHLRVTFDKAETGKGGFIFENHVASLNGRCAIDGTFRIETEDFDMSKLTQEQIMAVVTSQSFEAIRPHKINFVADAQFINDINIESFSGKISSKAGDIAPIQLNDMPDFLNDPDVVLDLANPAFFVEVDFPLPENAETKITLTSKYDDGTEPVVKETGTITIPAEKHVVFCIADHFEGIDVPEKYSDLEIVQVQVENLNELLKKLPKEIDVDVDDITMDIESMPIPNNYEIKVSYKVYTPIEFGPEFKLVYQGTEEGISDDLEDVDKLDAKSIRINAEAETNLPLDLVLSLDVLDKYNNSLKGSVVEVNDIIVDAHRGEEDFSACPVSIEIQPLPGHSINELLKKLDKFHYHAEISAEGYEGSLLENAYVKLNNIKITLVGGITYDAN